VTEQSGGGVVRRFKLGDAECAASGARGQHRRGPVDPPRVARRAENHLVIRRPIRKPTIAPATPARTTGRSLLGVKRSTSLTIVGLVSGLLVFSAFSAAAVGGTIIWTDHASPFTPSVYAFEAHLHDAPCSNTFCGSGKLTGFGTVKTWLAVRPFGASPAAGCYSVVGTRRLTLASDRKSTLRLAVKGALCGSRSFGTFQVSSGSGVFAGATGSGVILGSFTKSGHEHLHYSGVLTLARK